MADGASLVPLQRPKVPVKMAPRRMYGVEYKKKKRYVSSAIYPCKV